MRNRITVRVFIPNGRVGYRPGPVRTFASKARAVRWSEAYLSKHPVEHTRSLRATGRFCDLRDKQGAMWEIDAPEVWVKSVGEIGYW